MLHRLAVWKLMKVWLNSLNRVQAEAHSNAGKLYFMKTVFIGINAKIAELATASIGLRWPDATVLRAATATEGLGLIAQESPDLVIAHSVPPDIGLSQVVPELRAFSNVPLLAIGKRLEEPELVACLELGVDDYVQLPCSPPALMMRIYALLRLNGMTIPLPEIEAPLLSGELFISPPASQVFLNNQRVALTPAEFRMLYFLIKNRGSVVDNRTLELAVGLGQSEVDGLAPVKKYISSLQKKLNDNAQDPRWIAPDQGRGYLYVGPAPISETPRGVTVN